jgi:hypothetical protein
VQGGLARHACEIGVHGDSRDPREPIAGENQGPRVASFARNPRIDQDVLQLARTPSTGRTHPQARLPEPHAHAEVRSEMRCPRIVATVALSDIELRHAVDLGKRVCGRDYFHVMPHDTKTQTAR